MKDMLGSVVRAAVGVPQERLDVLAKIASAMGADNSMGNTWHEHLKKLLEEDLFSQSITFERNKHGHVVFEITGLDLTGAKEIERLKTAGYRIGDYARQILTSKKLDGYDVKHRLIAGQKYKVVLMPCKHITRDSDRTTKNLYAEAEKLGYDKPLAGIVPRIRETISDKQMEKMGFWYIAGLHDLISDANGYPGVLSSDRGNDGRWLCGCWDYPVGQWCDLGAFAFVLPAS